ncbi:WD domain-containing protein [Histoplasma capsulatum]|uniref:WD domain-containing protein n=1 Tax=Ajellomyces capsulatus TaxID=5037 RepID=A0A8H7Z824_AJECA|nr:WD domain-containing protein [Histoplasma capsulatum]
MEQGHAVRMVIVIDALDECEREDDVRDILRLLPRAQESNSVQVRVFFFFSTSRPDLPIRLRFKDIADDHQDFILHEIPDSVIKRDISLFLEHRFSEIRQESSKRGIKLSFDWPGGNCVSSYNVGSVVYLCSHYVPHI